MGVASRVANLYSSKIIGTNIGTKMRWTTLFLLFVAGAVSASTEALALPSTIHQEGLLTSDQGVRREGPVQLRFSLYDQAEGGEALWFEDHNLNLAEGYYSVILGQQNPLLGLFDLDPRYLGLSVDGVELLPRQLLSSVAYARQAEKVIGDIHPHSIYVDGQQIIDSGGNWVGPLVPGANDGVGYDTPAAILAALKSVDGEGSGLDSDLLDGKSSTAFISGGDQVIALITDVDGANSGLDVEFLDGRPRTDFLQTAARALELLLTTDGRNSSLDVDRIDNYDSTHFIRITNPESAAQILSLLTEVDGTGTGIDVDKLDGYNSDLFLKTTDPELAVVLLNFLVGLDGEGTSLDSDLLNGLQNDKFMRADNNTGTSGNLDINGALSANDAQIVGISTANDVEAVMIQTESSQFIPLEFPPESPTEAMLYFNSQVRNFRIYYENDWHSLNDPILEEDECAVGNHNCHDNAVCTNTPGGFSCACSPGFDGGGVNCIEIDECADQLDNCDINATCTNEQGSFLCTCNQGYSGDGVTCNDINECSDNTNNCHALATCNNTSGGFGCTCNPGYQGDGVNCVDTDECAEGFDNCHTYAACNNLPGGFECACLPGLVGDGLNCVDINECEENAIVCDEGYSCVNTPGSYRCMCGCVDDYIWTGEAEDDLWSSGRNWRGGAPPGADDVALFDDTCVNCNAVVDMNVNIKGIHMSAEYSGTVAQTENFNLTIGSENWIQNNGTFVGGNGTVDVNGNFYLHNGSFTAPGLLSVGYNGRIGEFVIDGGIFNHNSGTVRLDQIYARNGGDIVVQQINITSEAIFHNIEIKIEDTHGGAGYDNSTIEIIGNPLIVEGDLIHTDGAINNSHINLSGNLLTACEYRTRTICAGGGTTDVIFVENHPQQYASSSSTCQGQAIFTGTAGVVIPAGTEIRSDDGKTFTTDSNVTINSAKTINVWITATVPGSAGNTEDEHFTIVAPIDGVDSNVTIHRSYPLTNGGQVGMAASIVVNNTTEVTPKLGTDSFSSQKLTINSGSFISPSNFLDLDQFYLHSGSFTAPSGLLTIGFDGRIGEFVIDGGVFNHNSGRIKFDQSYSRNGGDIAAQQINVAINTSFYEMEVDVKDPHGGSGYNNSVLEIIGNPIAVEGDFIYTDGKVNGSSIQLSGDIILTCEYYTGSICAGGGTTNIIFISNEPQHYESIGSISQGHVIFTGTSGVFVPKGTELQSEDGKTFTTNSDITIPNSGTVGVWIDATVRGRDGNTDSHSLSLVNPIEGIDDTLLLHRSYFLQNGGRMGVAPNITVENVTNITPKAGTDTLYADKLTINAGDFISPTELLDIGEFYLHNGSFTAPNGLFSIGFNGRVGNFVVDGGLFDHNSGTIRFDQVYSRNGGNILAQLIDITSEANFYNMEVAVEDPHAGSGYNNSVLEIIGNPVVVEGDLLHEDGMINKGSILLNGKLTTSCKYYTASVCAGGGTTDLIFNSSEPQQYQSLGSTSQGHVIFTGAAGSFIPKGTELRSDDGKTFTTNYDITISRSGSTGVWVDATVPGRDGNTDLDRLSLVNPIEGVDDILLLHTSYLLNNGGHIGTAPSIIVDNPTSITPAVGTDTLYSNKLTINAGSFISPTKLLDTGEFYLHNGNFSAPNDLFIVGFNGRISSFVVDGGIFNHNNGTIRFDQIYSRNGGDILVQQINITSEANFYNMEVVVEDPHAGSGYNNSVLEIIGNPVVAEGDLLHKDGKMNKGSILLSGKLTVACEYYNGSVCAGGGSTEIILSSDNVQQYVSNTSSSQGLIIITGNRGTFIPAGTEFETDDGRAFTTDSNVTLNNSGSANAWVTATTDGVDGNSDSSNLVPVEPNDNIDGASVHTSYPLSNGGRVGESIGITLNSTSNFIPAAGTDSLSLDYLVINSGGFISPANMSVGEFYLHGGEFIAPSGTLTVGNDVTPHPGHFVVDGGAFDHNSGTIIFNQSYATRSDTVIQQIAVTSVANFNNVEVDLRDTHPTGGYNNSLLEITGDPIVIEGDFFHKDGMIRGGSILLGGNLTVFCKYYNGAVCAGGGTTDIIFSSNYVQRYSSHTSSSQGLIIISGTARTFIPAGTAFITQYSGHPQVAMTPWFMRVGRWG